MIDSQGRSANQLIRLDRTEASTALTMTAKSRLSSIRLWMFCAIFLAPMIVISIYHLIATPRYQSEFSFVVRSMNPSVARVAIPGFGQAGRSENNGAAVVAYIHSRDALRFIDRDGFARQTFYRASYDPFLRFPSFIRGESEEDFFLHFNRYVGTNHDQMSEITRVTVQAADAKSAQEIARRLLDAAERKINDLNLRADRDLLRASRLEVEKAQAALDDVLIRLGQVRSQTEVIDPRLQSGAGIAASSDVLSQLSAVEIELQQLARSVPTSPLIAQLRKRRDALDQQLANRQLELAGGRNSLSSRLYRYEQLKAERDIAERWLASVSLRMLQARDSVQKRKLYLERISEPSLPDEARYPRAWRNLLLSLFVSASMAWIAASLAEVFFGED